MVKKSNKTVYIIFSLAVILFINSCNVDLLGLFVSNDLDERLRERNNLKFLEDKNWTSMTLGDNFSFMIVTDTHIEDGDTFGQEGLAGIIAGNPDINSR